MMTTNLLFRGYITIRFAVVTRSINLYFSIIATIEIAIVEVIAIIGAINPYSSFSRFLARFEVLEF